MKKLKVMTVVGTRPEIIRLSRIIGKLDAYCEHWLVHTGQNYDYELNQIFFKDLGLRQPDRFLDAAGESAAETIARVITSADRLFAEAQPDALLVLGDTNSGLCVIPAKKRRIPIFHMEAGNRCFDQRVPEEVNRRLIDHTADVNLTYSAIARDYLLREGLPPDRVIRTGSPLKEVLQHNTQAIQDSDALKRLNLEEQEFFLVSAHREEHIDSPEHFMALMELLEKLAHTHALPVVVSTHPRTRKRIDAAARSLDPRIRLVKPLGFHDYVHLQTSARAVLSDSGTISEESAILNFPALNIRETHERPEAMEEGAVMMTGMNPERVMQGLAILRDQARGEERVLRPVSDYEPDNVSEKVLRILHSYTDYVNRVVWKKDPDVKVTSGSPE